MNKIAKKILIFGISLIALSFLLLIHFEWEEKYSKRESNNIMNKLIDEESKNEENNLMVINDLEYIGYIVIPSLDLNLPVSKNFSYSSLKKTPALYYGSVKNNNLVICGHSYKSHFGYLYKLKKGDEIIFIDVNNNKYIYKVELVEELESTDIKKMIESDFDLTLYTCTKDGLRRVTVRCNRI